ncbi:endonuclease-reverse transcriptase domain-containing protein [Phthorimaea operculella]|nr:endonuclease-reverse transcriptase domain-containing protein [Phthorimaea operculella]
MRCATSFQWNKSFGIIENVMIPPILHSAVTVYKLQGTTVETQKHLPRGKSLQPPDVGCSFILVALHAVEVLCCVRRELCAARRTDWVSDSFESLWLTISSRVLHTQKNLNIILSYTPPDVANILPPMINEYLSNLKRIHENGQSDEYYLLIGDFNLPCLRWNTDGWSLSHVGSTLLQTTASDFVEELSLMGLNQYNIIPNRSDNVLDLCFCNLPLVITATHELTKVDALHPPLSVEIPDLFLKPLVENKTSRFNFRKCDYELVNAHLSKIDWDQVSSILAGLHRKLSFIQSADAARTSYNDGHVFAV